MSITLPAAAALCLVTLVVLCNVHGIISLEHKIPRSSFLSRRAIDGTRGSSKYFNPDEEGAFDSYGSAGGQYDPYQEKTDLSDIRRNVPGEPGIDYPAYTTLPQTGFTCEERSRGYYADQEAGCQVFHVCHDVLVSSFLCPIGSIFSQKLLTCDWWTKVDCSSSNKYIDVNRNSYQQDDDEMIRNAYVMISLRSGMDITEDGLVDPDRTGSVVLDYQTSLSRILNYSPIGQQQQQHTTGNDLKSNFDHYAGPISRNFQPPYHHSPQQQQNYEKLESGTSYQRRFYYEESRSPYEDSPIIRVQKINDPDYGGGGGGGASPAPSPPPPPLPYGNTDIQQNYRRPINQFADQFQPSYAPTVPTVTTTTRRFYSPTVPTTTTTTTFTSPPPSSSSTTLAHNNKSDQDIDSSGYYFSHGTWTEGFVTPTLLRPPTFMESSRDDDYYTRQDTSYEDYEDINSGETKASGRSTERFLVRVADDLNLNKTRSLNETRPLPLMFSSDYRDFNLTGYNGDFVDDFETKDSIGLGHALHDSLTSSISVHQKQYDPSVQNKSKQETGSHKEEINIRSDTLIDAYKSADSLRENKDETTNRYQIPPVTTNHDETEKFVDDIFVLSITTPSSAIETTTIKARTNDPRETSLKLPNSEFLHEKDSIDKITDNFGRTILKPPQNKFRIKVPDLIDVTSLPRYSASVQNREEIETTTELPTTFLTTTYSADHYIVHCSTCLDENLKRDDLHVAATFDSKNHRNDTNEEQSSSVMENGILLPSVSLHLSKNIPLNETSSNKEKLTKNLNKTSIQVSTNDRKSKDNRSLIYGRAEELRRSSGERDSIEAATAVNIRSEILKQIEKIVGVSDSPYRPQVIIANKDQETVSFIGDFIDSKSDVRKQGKGIVAALDDKLVEHEDELEIVKSVDPVVRRTRFETTTKIVDSSTVNDESNNSKNNTEFDNFKNRKTINLLHLASELLKLDRVPRPFSRFPSDTSQNVSSSSSSSSSSSASSSSSSLSLSSSPPLPPPSRQSNTIRNLKDLTTNRTELKNETTTTGHYYQETTTTTTNKDSFFPVPSAAAAAAAAAAALPPPPPPPPSPSRPRAKEQILGQLAEYFGDPLYGSERKSVDRIHEKEYGSFWNFHASGLLRSSETTTTTTTVAAAIAKESSEGSKVPESSPSSNETMLETTTLSTEKTITTTTTLVKTEFVPSIGFSFDTSEGREEYVEAVLGGLIEPPQPAESKRKETILKESFVERGDASSKKNETLTK